MVVRLVVHWVDSKDTRWDVQQVAAMVVRKVVQWDDSKDVRKVV